jgi:predicted small integral membrane protein
VALRLAKIIMAASMAVFASLVAIDNVLDYGTNYSFVEHVLSMDTTFATNTLRWRAITEPVLWHAAYWVIIVGEALTGAAYTVGTFMLIRVLRANGEAFNDAKYFVYLATALGFLVWFFGFMVIGGEWFSMWQSSQWNGQEAAFRFYVAVLGVGIFIALRDRDLPARSPGARQR